MSARRSSGARAIAARPDSDDELGSEATPIRAASRRSSDSTPYSRLRQLAGAIHKPSTPLRRARTPSIGPVSGRRGERTPASHGRTPGLGRPPRPVVSRQTKPTTPHAIRALQQRKAAAAASTPGRERRRSGRQQRETPRDILRALSRVERVSTRSPAKEPPPAIQEPRRTIDFAESDSEPDEPRPNLTLPIDDDDDDDDESFQAPPRLSQAFEDGNDTQVSIEAPRRALAEQGRLSAGLRTSDRFGDVDLDTRARLAAEGADDSMDLDMYGVVDDGDQQGDETGDLRDLLRDGQPSLPGDVTLGLDDAENSFAFRLPPELADEDVEDVEAEAEAEAEADSGHESEVEPFPEDLETANITMHTAKPSTRKAKVLNQSRYGIPYPSLPAGVVKKLTATALKSSGAGKTRVNSQILAAVMQASDWFFEQLGEDLEAYSNHAKRKTIDESDVVTLMKRQRILSASTTPFSLAQKLLPRELLQDLRMVQQPKAARRRVLERIVEEDE